MGERRRGESGEPGTGFPAESEEPSSLLQRAVAVLQSSYLDSTSQDGFQYSRAILVENDVFLSELKAFARAKEAAGYSREELQETFAFLLFDKEEEAKEVCQTGLRVNSSSISTLGDPAKGVYISRYSDCLHPRPWQHGNSGYIVICKLIKGKVRAIAENATTTFTCPSPGYDCHVSNHGPTRSSPCQAFEQSQYYVYEVSGGSTAERPRQVCPYIFLACQYREPKDMPVLAIENPAERNHKALYCPWRGQLSIRGRLLCPIALRTPYSSTIPAQLPPNLDINHVMGLSDLKKKLPEAAFGKKNYTGNEVCFQGVYSSLYEVEISNRDQPKMDQLVENLKEKDLAIIKYLHERGVLILLASSALARERGLEPKEPVSLLALFLFPSPRALGPAAGKRDPKDEREGGDRSDLSLKIASVLPGLRYALRKAASSSWNDAGSTSTWIKEHLQEYAKLRENSRPTPGPNSDVPIPSVPSPSEDEGAPPSRKLSERSLSQLQRYLSDPGSYALGMSAALECLSGAAPCPGSDLGADPGNSSSAVPPHPAPRSGAAGMPDKAEAPSPAPELEQGREGSPKDSTSPSKLWGQQNRRKSSRILGKNPSPLKTQTHPGEDDGRNREAAKKKFNITFSFPKKSGSAANSSEPMLKLANLQFPHGRKRGAEVLAAEIVHKTQREPAEKETSAPGGPGLEAKRPKTLENPDVKKVPVVEGGAKPGRSKTPRSVENSASKAPDSNQAESEWKEPFSELPSEASSQSHGAESQRSEVYPVGIPSGGFALHGDHCESHALNLLADLALGSCIPPFIPKDCGIIPASCSPSSDSKEQQSPSKPKSPRVASDHRYHRADKHGRKATSACKASLNQLLPEKTDSNHSASPPWEKTFGIFNKSSVNPNPAVLQALPPREAPEAAEVNKHSIIAAEHSYASPMPEHPRKHPNPKGNPSPGPAPSRNGGGSAPAAPLVGKVLPFRHQQSSTSEPARSWSSPRKKEDFAKSHTVNVSGNSVKVTCRWEEEYLFHLDSRYTNDSLEKTVIRALHGPWDPDLPDDVEGMKLILHMWVALFYRKPSKLLNSSRKVVEHSNPRKFVSINSSGSFLELSDDSQDCFGFETRPADSGSDPDQTPSSSLDPSTPSQGTSQPERSPADSQTDADGTAGAVDSTVSSSSGELPCGEEEEPSSTSCPESLSLRDDAGESLDAGAGEPEVVPEERARDASSVTAEDPVKEDPLDAGITPSPSEELRCSGESPAGLGTENPGSQAPNSSTAPWTDPPCALREVGEQQEQWEVGSGSGPGPPEDGEGMGDAGHALGAEGGTWASGADPQPARDSMPLEASPGFGEPGGATGEGEESREPSEPSEKEEREVEEEKGENEGFEDESSFLEPVDLVLSESSDAEMECEHGKQNPGNSASPEEFGVPEEDPVPSPTSLASPCPDRSTPALSDGTGTDPGGFPEEMSPNQDELPDPWDAPATPDSETNGVGVGSPAEAGSPHSEGGEPPFPPGPSPVGGAQPDSVTDDPGAAGATLGNGVEQKNRDRAPSAESWEPAGSTAGPESSCGQGMTLTLSPDSSSLCPTSPDGSVDPWAAPEDQPMESIQSPSQSDLGRSSCFSQACGDDADPDLNSLDAEESNQGGNGVLVEEQHGSASADCAEELDDPMGAGDGQDSPFGYTDTGDDSRAEESEDVFPGPENSPGNDTTSVEMVADVEPEIPVRPHRLESEPSSSSIREGVSAIKELPRKRQSFPSFHGDPAPASPARAGDPNPAVAAVPSRRESVLCRLWKPCREGGAAQVSVAAWSLDGSLNPSCSPEAMRAPAPRSPVDAFVPAEPGSAPPSPCDPWEDPEGAEPGSPLPEALPGMLPPTPDSARWSGSCGSPGSRAGDAGGSLREEPIPPEDLEGGSIPSPAPFPAGECLLCEPWAVCEHNPEGSEAFPDPSCAGAGEGEIPASPMPGSPSDEHRDLSRESPELSDAEDISDVLPREEQLPSQDTHEGLAFEDPLEIPFGDSEQEYFDGNSQSPLPSRSSCIMRSRDAAGTRTNWDSSSRSSVHTEELGEDWDRGVPRDCGSFVVTRQCQQRMENSQPPKRRGHRARESHLFRSLLGTWRGFEEITQNTLDMECLRFHYKLKQILRNGKPPFSTSKSIFPKDFSSRDAPAPLSPRSRSPLQVTIPPSGAWLAGHRDTRDTRRARSRARSRDHGAPFHLGKLSCHHDLPASRGDVAVILDEYSEFQRVVLSRAGSEGPAQGEAGNARIGMGRARGTAAFPGAIAELCGALRSHLRRVAADAGGQPGMFYLLETGKEPFFDRLKALLKAAGFVRTEPPSFCGAPHRDGERLLVVVRNEDVSSHIHSVPCLLELKRRPCVVFAGVDDPEDVTGGTFQELFQAGGFVVSDEELLERVTLGQLREVVKVLEKLNRNARWKWLLHYRESRKLRGDLSRDNAQKKQLLLKWCQGAELVELLPFHGCDSAAAPESQRFQCLLELQAQHVRARFAVYLTENPSSREILESKGILVADVSTFLGTVQKVAAPFRRSYW